jgi:carboxylesterase type B
MFLNIAFLQKTNSKQMCARRFLVAVISSLLLSYVCCFDDSDYFHDDRINDDLIDEDEISNDSEHESNYDDVVEDDESEEPYEYRVESCYDPEVNYSRSNQRQISSNKVKIDGGYIKGDENYLGYSFRGIPYAEPPVGNLRFANPKRYSQTWRDVRTYDKFGPKCAQYNHFGYKFSGKEDCLTLNVFVPRKVVQRHLLAPVIFYIHGGAFMFGGSQYYGAENFMIDQRMVVVTVNYRLGILGFLSTEDLVMPGNLGLKDQVEALRWVQRNIAAFMGDPKLVTLSGFSAGAASVHLHFMSGLTKGLFNNGISHSGTALDPWVMQEDAEKKAHDTAARFGCNKTSAATWIVDCLRKVPVRDLVMFASHYQRILYNPFSPFGVVVEPFSPTAFLLAEPKVLLERGWYKNLSWILSETKDEGLYPAAEFVDRTVLKSVDTKWIDYAPYLLDYAGSQLDFYQQVTWSIKIRKEYFKDKAIDLMSFYDFRRVKA